MTPPDWHAIPSEAVLDDLGASRDGLTADEARRRAAEHGPNELPVTPPSPVWFVLARQFRSPLVLFLLVCAVVTISLQDWNDTIAIIVVLLLNAVVGFWQEQKAAREVRALQSLSTPTATAVRGGRAVTVAAAEIVPGDVVALEPGDRVPADVRLIESAALRVDESMLTGESVAVDKRTSPVDADATMADRTNSAFSGSLVVAGRGIGVVTATGEGTELGGINELVQGASERTPLQRIIRRLEVQIGVAVAGVAVAIFVVGLVLGMPFAEMLLVAVALIVSAMPEALPLVLTIALAVGTTRMASRRAVVRRLASVETLGSTTVIASDKTGTLTRNRLTVERLWTPGAGLRDLSTGERPAEIDWRDDEREAMRAGALTNEARFAEPASADADAGADGAADGDLAAEALVGDAVDVAMAAVALSAGVVSRVDVEAVPLRVMHYEPEFGFSQAVVDRPGGPVLVVKGAPDRVLLASSRMRDGGENVPIDRGLVIEANERLGSEGLRVLATAERPVDDEEAHADGPLPPPHELVFLGLEGMTDPPREGVVEAVGECQRAGVRVVMVTGDHAITARAIADRLGLGDGRTITGGEVAGLDDRELDAVIEDVVVAARMTPHDKLRIVGALERRGETVAVTGDGVNDAPALRAAAIGVAMGASGTEVAREAADVVLLDDNFSTIVSAVRQGRITFDAVRKATFFLLSSAVASLLAVAVSVFTDEPIIFLPIMLLWTNIVTNGVQDVALAFERGEGGELEQPPRARSEGVLDRTLWLRTGVTGVWMGLWTLTVYLVALRAGLDLERARTLAVTTLVMFNFFQVFSARAIHRSAFTVSPFSNPLLLASAFGALALHWGAMSWDMSAAVLGFAPLTAIDWLVSAALGITVLLIVEGEKAVRVIWRRRTMHVPRLRSRNGAGGIRPARDR
ncbi:ATPase [Pseudoclavibacter endophyticus]|uniref:HAD-IC family P-type ATPase n=1 Tax=Pseudoclavibacter endophyticus TaxID=1778590 RepID=A0A6H9WSD0_9MICO|nr:HAD-IC family P-type ATPase [Pseudoclavibacter endophyticus]KAB1649615.1 HAD-IC family P-type ATPase [Pseudoclavibacter endophyticus]GGA61212.1 ATPase [Pseudoclavibacter endophyticus]